MRAQTSIPVETAVGTMVSLESYEAGSGPSPERAHHSLKLHSSFA